MARASATSCRVDVGGDHAGLSAPSARTSPQGAPRSGVTVGLCGPPACSPHWAGAKTKLPGLDGRARSSVCREWAWPVSTVKAEGHGEEAGAGLRQGAVEMGEAQVVADGEPDLAPGRIRTTAARPGRKVSRLAIALAAPGRRRTRYGSCRSGRRRGRRLVAGRSGWRRWRHQLDLQRADQQHTPSSAASARRQDGWMLGLGLRAAPASAAA